MRPEKKQVELTEEEKSIIDLLKVSGSVSLSTLKEQTGLSGKKWDAAMKGLAKHNLVKVVVAGDFKTVSLSN
jgi:lysyl-tRNA synthetase, class II